MIKLIISLASLFAPTVWELSDDARGDHNKTQDVLLRCLIGLAAALLNFFLIGKPILDSFLLSMAIHFMFFDYAIAFILIRNGKLEPPRGVKYHWFSYVAKKGPIDNIGFWKRMEPKKKLWVRVGVVGVAILIYIL
jgi:hypothetical protein